MSLILILLGAGLLTYQACGKPFKARTVASLASVGGTTDDPPPPPLPPGPTLISDIAPDAALTGPLATVNAEYRLPARVDATVLANQTTEIWAQIYRPQNMPATPAPVLVFLHGNHATCGIPSSTAGGPRLDDDCQYTDSGTCPAGYVVTPNHLGYAYMAERLASWGYFVVSINANRGITCANGDAADEGLIQARGRLVLRHLQELAKWNSQGGAPASLGLDLRARLDLSQVGLMGHSRGGEGVRAAYNLYYDSGSAWVSRITQPVNIRAVFEIAPVDAMSNRIFNLNGAPWAVLLPMCDGDVADLSGIEPFDRMLTSATSTTPAATHPKTAITVWGANHNFYNTEWQESDSEGCRNHTPLWSGTQIGSPGQRQTGLATLMAFFRAHVGIKQPEFARNLDGAFKLPPSTTSITRVDRSFLKLAQASSGIFLENFNQTAPRGTLGLNHITSQVTWTNQTLPPHASVRRAGKISWSSASSQTFLKFQLASGAPGLNLSQLQSLDFDLSRADDPKNPVGVPSDFEVQIEDTSGQISAPVRLGEFFRLVGPVGNFVVRPVLTSVRLPLSRFQGVDLSRVVAVKWTFNRTSAGVIYAANLRATDNQMPDVVTPPLQLLAETNLKPGRFVRAAGITESLQPRTARLSMVRPVPRQGATPRSTEQGGTAQNTTDPGRGESQSLAEVEITSSSRFPVTNSMPSLTINGQRYVGGHFPKDGDTRRMIFRLPTSEATKLQEGSPAAIEFGANPARTVQIVP